MSVFKGWDNYIDLLKNNWNNLITPDDHVVLMGDSSWAMRIDDAYEDFNFIKPYRRSTDVTDLLIVSAFTPNI